MERRVIADLVRFALRAGLDVTPLLVIFACLPREAASLDQETASPTRLPDHRYPH